MARINVLDPRIASKPLGRGVVGIDIGRTYTRRVLLDDQGQYLCEPRIIRTGEHEHKGWTEMVVELIADLPERVSFCGLTAAGQPDEDGRIILTNRQGSDPIDPVEIEFRTGMSVTKQNDVMSFTLGTTLTTEYEEIKPGRQPANSSGLSERVGVFYTSGMNTARAQLIRALSVWTVLGAEAGWVGLQTERGNLMEEWFLIDYVPNGGEIGVELMVSLGSGIANWHQVLRRCPKKVLEYYKTEYDVRLPLDALRPCKDLLQELEDAGDEPGPVMSRRAVAGDPYATMVMRALCAMQGAATRVAALQNYSEFCQGIWINSPMMADQSFRAWMRNQTRFTKRFLGADAVGNGRRFSAEYLAQLPVNVVTDTFVVPTGAAAHVTTWRVLDGGFAE